MKPEVLEYGFRSSRSGEFVRIDEYEHDDGYDNGATLVRRLTFEREYPVLQDTELAGIVAFRYGKLLLNTFADDFTAGSDVEVDDLEPVEFFTSSEPRLGGGSDRLVTDVRAMRFDIVRDVKMEDAPKKGKNAVRLQDVFEAAEIDEMLGSIGRPNSTHLDLVILKGRLLDFDPRDLPGKVLVCDPNIRPLVKSGSYGVLQTRVVDGTTYAAVVYGAAYPCFYSAEPGSGNLESPPWDTLQATFSVDGSSEVAVELLLDICEHGQDEPSPWPPGWTLKKVIPGYGNEMIAFFDVFGLPSSEEGAQVRAALSEIEAGHDIRLEESRSTAP